MATSNLVNDDGAVGGSAHGTLLDADGRNRIMVGEPQSTSSVHVNTFTTSGGAEDVDLVLSISTRRLSMTKAKRISKDG